MSKFPELPDLTNWQEKVRTNIKVVTDVLEENSNSVLEYVKDWIELELEERKEAKEK